ncbi:histidine phosphatase family protein [Variovorax sp. HJSM1_2]|uniref:histidine phosphatase family protein n=1 Tax=Variovorax sp. HJSM1_2 TaxID=3366263 RepID=UPI003BE4078D
MLATRIIAIRHGETAWNVDSRIQGHLDIPLNDVGRAQAARAAAALADESVQAVYASDLLRAFETAQAIAQTLALPVQIDKGLREREFGAFQGRTFAEIEAEAPELAMRWRKREPDFSPAGGESLNLFRDRILQTVNALAAAHLGEQIVLVAHGGVMDVLYRAATGQGVQAPRTWQLSNAAINRLLWTPDGLTLVGWADTQHLDDLSLDENAT